MKMRENKFYESDSVESDPETPKAPPDNQRSKFDKPRNQRAKFNPIHLKRRIQDLPRQDMYLLMLRSYSAQIRLEDIAGFFSHLHPVHIKILDQEVWEIGFGTKKAAMDALDLEPRRIGNIDFRIDVSPNNHAPKPQDVPPAQRKPHPQADDRDLGEKQREAKPRRKASDDQRRAEPKPPRQPKKPYSKDDYIEDRRHTKEQRPSEQQENNFRSNQRPGPRKGQGQWEQPEDRGQREEYNDKKHFQRPPKQQQEPKEEFPHNEKRNQRDHARFSDPQNTRNAEREEFVPARPAKKHESRKKNYHSEEEYNEQPPKEQRFAHAKSRHEQEPRPEPRPPKQQPHQAQSERQHEPRKKKEHPNNAPPPEQERPEHVQKKQQRKKEPNPERERAAEFEKEKSEQPLTVSAKPEASSSSKPAPGKKKRASEADVMYVKKEQGAGRDEPEQTKGEADHGVDEYRPKPKPPVQHAPPYTKGTGRHRNVLVYTKAKVDPSDEQQDPNKS